MQMTTGEMLEFTNRFKNIQVASADQNIKDMRLASLMSDLEGSYQIPMLKNEKFEAANPHVMQLYRTVSAARVF